MHKLLTILLFAISFLPFAKRVHAASDFSTSFASTYTISEDSDSRVAHQIQITNNSAHLFLTEYTISIGSSLSNLQVSVNGKKAPFRQDVSGNLTTLTVEVTDPVIGKNQVLDLGLAYETPSLVQTYGKSWEINIPRLSRANEAATYTRRVIVPQAFGTPAVESPHSTTTTSLPTGEIVLDYVGYPSDGITLLFGESVTYRLELSYEITNPTLTSADTEIALPPDTEYQSVSIEEIIPAPELIKTDSDHNWLAVYPLRSQESRQIRAILNVTVYPIPTFPSLPIDRPELLTANKYWDRTEAIESLAGRLQSPLNIYNYLTENLDYDYSRLTSGNRLGAAQALSQPGSAICTEFTDTFVALSRAAGIPAREINGFAWTADSAFRPSGFAKDILHAWPEYYDESRQSWVQIDPTWSKTTGGVDYFHKLDYGHLTFVRRGRESDYPHPAGIYKSNSNDQTIRISLVSEMPVPSISFREQTKPGFNLITNTGRVAIRDQVLTLADGQKAEIDYLPPYGSVEIKTISSGSETWFAKILSFLKSSCGKLNLCANL